MDTTSIITLVSVIVLLTALVIYSKRISKKKWQQAYNSFEKFVLKNDGTISRYASWNKSAIGLDNKSHKVFFKKTGTGNEQEIVIDLSTVKKCDINIVKIPANQTVRMVELVFIPKDNKYKNTSIEFYNVDDKLTLGTELQIIEEWHKIIASDLKLV